MGDRRTMITTSAYHRIPTFIRTGASVRMACAMAGMSYHAMRLKAASDPAFLREIQEAKRYAQQHRGLSREDALRLCAAGVARSSTGPAGPGKPWRKRDE